MEKDWVKVFSTGQLQRAELVKAMLEENDIQAVVMNKQSTPYLIGEIEVYVRKLDALRANQLITKRAS